MSKYLVINVKAKDTLIACLKPDDTSTYIDGIIKGLSYANISQYSITVKNVCNTPFMLPAQVLFTQNDNLGSTFEASIINTVVPAQTTVQVPVYYNGVYNGVSNNPIYNFVLNGTTINYQLIIEHPDTLGTIVDFTIALNNRQDRVFIPSDFTNHFTDPDNDTIVSIFLSGNVSTIWYNNLPYIADTEVTMIDIALGRLKHVAPNVNNFEENSPVYKVKDSLGNIIT